MSTEAGEDRAPGPGGAAPADAEDRQEPSSDEKKGKDDRDDQDKEQPDRPQDAWSARRDLRENSPRTMNVGADARFGGSLVGGDQHGISGGRVAGDVIMGSKTVYHFGFSATSHHASGEIPQATLERLAAYFVTDEQVFDGLVRRLRTDRVLVLSGPHFSGRRTAALMLLHRIGATPVRALDRTTTPAALAQQLGGGDEEAPPARGHLLCDLATRRDQPLRETHLLALRDRLAKDDAHLVITVGPTAALEDVVPAEWAPPSPADVLAAHLRMRTGDETAQRLLALPAVAGTLARGHQLREIAAFAGLLERYAAGQAGETELADFSLAALEAQVQEWFEADEATVHLRDKAFLVALAAFDGGPYALTAELSDTFYSSLLRTENASLPPAVPVFGTHIGKRLQLARAGQYWEDTHTEWGPVTQMKAAFRDDRAALVLLREVWTGHPSARPALVGWLRQLAEDGRPLVRTRAASTVAVLAYTDLPSAMALVIEPWATANRYRQRLVAVNALALAHFLGTPNIPRILDGWCAGRDQGLSWVAIRAYALIGPERPEQTLKALRGAAREQYGTTDDPRDPDPLMLETLAESVELLLLSPAQDQVLAELVRTRDDDRAARDLALGGFISACVRTEDDERYGMPLVLGWYARSAADGGQPAWHIAELWRGALGDRTHTLAALEVLRQWVLVADRSETTEWALAALLPALVTTPAEHQRVGHLLRTMPGEDGAPPPSAAGRLLTVLPPP
ncbi:hypothetical protein ACWCP6_03700 [Streptomyces sp. NPDC002004]